MVQNKTKLIICIFMVRSQSVKQNFVDQLNAFKEVTITLERNEYIHFICSVVSSL